VTFTGGSTATFSGASPVLDVSGGNAEFRNVVVAPGTTVNQIGSGFFQTITGTLTNCCCESTARDAMQLNYRVLIPADANAAHPPPTLPGRRPCWPRLAGRVDQQLFDPALESSRHDERAPFVELLLHRLASGPKAQSVQLFVPGTALVGEVPKLLRGEAL